MAQPSPDDRRLVVVILTPGSSVEATLEHALREARDSAVELDREFVVDVLLVVTDEHRDTAGTEARIERTASAFDAGGSLRTNFDVLSAEADEPSARTEAILAHVGDASPARIVVQSDAAFAVERLHEAFGTATVELAPTETPQERRRLLHPGGARRLVTIFGLTYLFYLGVGGFVGGLDFLTGAVSAAVVALSLSHVALRDEPSLRTVRRLGRTFVFLPVLLWEIAKANVVIAAVILHPRLPIDPSMGTVEFDAPEGIEQMVLANSIALTPGTLTVDVDEETFVVHELTAGAREALVDGPLQRYVTWVFHGADAAAESGALAENDGGGEGR